jgi:hypothetical protein
MKVKIVRAILHEGKHQKIGTVLDVPKELANELVFSKKCVFASGEPEEPGKKESKK